MAKTRIRFSYQDYLQLPEDKRYELIDGEFYMVPSPGVYHQTILMKLFRILYDYVVRQKQGELYFAPLDVVLSEEDVIQPDILFIPKERSHIITETNIQGAPDLIIEILFPATAERDKGLKRKLYAKYGIGEYWIVNPETKSIEVMTLGEKGFQTIQVYKMGESLGSPLLKELSFNLEEVF